MENGKTGDEHKKKNSPNLRIVLLQYNTHIHQDSMDDNLVVTKFHHGHPMTFEDGKRKLEIVKNIRKLKPDIVALEEVMARNNQEWFVNQLHDILPYHAFGPQKSNLLESSGIVLLSKYKIESSAIYIYKNRNRKKILNTNVPLDFKDNTLCNKGVIVAEICGPEGRRFVISVTHTADDKDINQLVNFTSKTAKKFADNCPIIITGDLNVHAQARPNMLAEFDKINAKDVWTVLNKDQVGNTINNAENLLFRILNPDRKPDPNKTSDVDRLDYVFFTQPIPGSNYEATLTPVSARVIQDWTTPLKTEAGIKDVDLSDHYPLQVIFSLD